MVLPKKKYIAIFLGAYLEQGIQLEFRYMLVHSKKICSKTPPLNWHSYEDKLEFLVEFSPIWSQQCIFTRYLTYEGILRSKIPKVEHFMLKGP